MTGHDDIIAIQQSLTHDFDVANCNSAEALEQELARRINFLIQADFHRLLAILYRLDISESKLRQTLDENQGRDAGELIAALIMEREWQKLHSRRKFSSSRDIPDDEKW